MDKLTCLSVIRPHKQKPVIEITFGVESTGNVDCEIFLTSDEHYDSKDCLRSLIKQQWDFAKERDMPIISLGDFLDVMGGKDDRRSDKRSLRPEYSYGSEAEDWSYLGAVAKDAIKFLENYKDNLLVMVKGNHEESIHKHKEFAISNLLTEVLREKGSKVLSATYRGFIRLRFVELDNPGRMLGQHDIFYTHGGGGNAPVTQGALWVSRVLAYAAADTYIAGHIHTEWNMSRSIVGLSPKGHLTNDKKLFIQLGTFKAFNMGDEWAARMGLGTPALGAQKLGIQIRREKNIRSVSAVATRLHQHTLL